ncbi:hypothetical protein GWO43_23890 [candidate division KSB1 bacterium]|nr:hypothetical protein [candidate division KSB1 bacterium]NIR73312.1 hypothetical protein [candidate division KSB1 bacterium]NIS27018.1 hypothetical protein [candidate division KSB1 bacterium]NIT73858.1 hypothetical protein [candidate division KSB1 bacterium]NIU27763.1 hypothetical protein [candidate division KSB1 bacterium]
MTSGLGGLILNTDTDHRFSFNTGTGIRLALSKETHLSFDSRSYWYGAEKLSVDGVNVKSVIARNQYLWLSLATYF